MRKILTTSALALTLALGLSACGDDDDDDDVQQAPGTATSQAPAATEAAPTDGATTGGQTDPDDLTGDDLQRASDAALQATGEGRVIEAERNDADDDDRHAFEVEVLLDNNEDVTVELDEDFGLIRIDN